MDQLVVDVTEQKRLNEAREAQIPWKKWGPYLSERQWGTVREDYSDDGNAWDYFTARPVPLASLSVGRGRARRALRRQATAVLRARFVERAGPHPERAPVRTHQQRGQPRRGRQGVLLLPRLDADPFVHEVSLQVPAARVSLPRTWSRRTGDERGKSSNTSCWTRGFSTTTGTSTSSSSTRRRGRTTS